MEVHGAAGQREMGATQGERVGPRRRTARSLKHGEPPEEDPTLEHPRCVFQILQAALRALHARAGRARSAACPREQFLEVAEALCDELRAASGRRRSATPSAGRSTPSACRYIRAAAILQLLLGNIGRPGGGILALRGHASIQGSTDIPTLYNILPGYLPMPHAQRARRPRASSSS